MKIKPDKLYRVEWIDICNYSAETLKKPYNQYLVPSWSVGYIKQSKDTIIVIFGGNENDDSTFDAIPKKLVTNIIPL
jgi:hypothetical protein